MWTVAEPRDSLYIRSCHSGLMLDLFKVCRRWFIHFPLIAFSLQQFVFCLHCSSVRVSTTCNKHIVLLVLCCVLRLLKGAFQHERVRCPLMTLLSQAFTKQINQLCLCLRKTVWGDVTSVYSKGAFHCVETVLCNYTHSQKLRPSELVFT